LVRLNNESLSLRYLGENSRNQNKERIKGTKCRKMLIEARKIPFMLILSTHKVEFQLRFRDLVILWNIYWTTFFLNSPEYSKRYVGNYENPGVDEIPSVRIDDHIYAQLPELPNLQSSSQGITILPRRLNSFLMSTSTQNFDWLIDCEFYLNLCYYN